MIHLSQVILGNSSSILWESLVGCHWFYTMSVGSDSKISRFKARLVAKEYTQTFGSDYRDTPSPLAIITYVRLLLHGALGEEVVYMEQQLGLSLFLWGSHLLWFIGYTCLSMVLNNLLKLGFTDLAHSTMVWYDS